MSAHRSMTTRLSELRRSDVPNPESTFTLSTSRDLQTLSERHAHIEQARQHTLFEQDTGSGQSRGSTLLNSNESSSTQNAEIEIRTNEEPYEIDKLQEDVFGFPSYFWRDIWIETSDHSLCARSCRQRLQHYDDDEHFRSFRDGFCKYFMSISPRHVVPQDTEGLSQLGKPTDASGINDILQLGLGWMNARWLFDAQRKAHALEIERLNEWSLPIPQSGFKISFIRGTVFPAQLVQDAFYYEEKFELLKCLLQMGAGFDPEGKEVFRDCMEDLMGRWTEKGEIDKWVTIAMRYKLQPFTPDFLVSLTLVPPEPKVTRNITAMLQLLSRKGCISGFESTPLRSLLKVKYSRLFARNGVSPGTSYYLKQKWAMDFLVSSDCLAALIERHGIPDPDDRS